MHLNSVQVDQSSVTVKPSSQLCSAGVGRQMCFVEPCSVDSGRAQMLEFHLGPWVLAPNQRHEWLLGVYLAVKLA